MAPKLIFVSYARVDSDFAVKISTGLRDAGANLWLDKLDIRAGATWDIEIEKALVSCDCLLFIVSQASAESENVLNEVYYALEEKKRVLPIKIDGCKIPFRIRRLQYIDFSSSYDTGFNNLLKTLDIEDKPETLFKGRELPGDEEPDLWALAKDQDTKDAYEGYLAKYPKGKFQKEARQLLINLSFSDVEQKKSLDEHVLWAQALAGNSVESFTNYLSVTNLGTYTKEAGTAIAAILKDEEGKVKLDNLPAGYNDSSHSFTTGEPPNKHAGKYELQATHNPENSMKWLSVRWSFVRIALPGLIILLALVWFIPKLINNSKSPATEKINGDSSLTLGQRNTKTALGYLAALSRHDSAYAINFLSNDYILYDLAGTPYDSGHALNHPATTWFYDAFPNFKLENISTESNGNIVTLQNRLTGTFTGRIGTQKPSGKSFACSETQIFGFDRAGQISSIRTTASDCNDLINDALHERK